MSSDKKINYVELPASNFDQLQEFYTRCFGWTFTDYGPEYRAFSDGNLDGGFYLSELKSQTTNGAALIVMYANDLEAMRETIVSNGGTICRDILSFPGGRRFQFLDPSGNELAVWSDK